MNRFALYAIGFGIVATITTTLLHPPRTTSLIVATTISLAVMAYGFVRLALRRGH